MQSSWELFDRRGFKYKDLCPTAFQATLALESAKNKLRALDENGDEIC